MTEISETEIERAQGAQQGAPPPPPPPPAPAAPSPEAQPPLADGAVTGEKPAPAEAAPPAAAEPQLMDQNWPFRGYDGPQPWEAENTPALTQDHRMVGSGSAGEEVQALADTLATLGYTTSISHGSNPTLEFDETVASAVRAFCSEYGVKEDPAVLRARTEDTVGPWIWEALTRAANKARFAAAEEHGE